MQVATNLKAVVASVPNMLNVQPEAKTITVTYDMQTEELSYAVKNAEGTDLV